MDLNKMTALEIGKKIKNKDISSVEVTKYFLNKIKKHDKHINAFITISEDKALKNAEEIQKKINKGEINSPFTGVPIAIKDNICTKDILTSCASKMLKDFKPVYNATVIDKLENAGMIVLGKTNMDEFAMGSSTETSYYGVTKNPWDFEKVAGGSSGGAAACVVADEVPLSLGSDTGGSIRQPCSFCGVSGIKPTYGSVSRFGLIAFASSLDQIGTISRNIKDCAELLSIISGYDAKDSTSIKFSTFDFSSSYSKNIKGIKIGIPLNYYEKIIDDDTKNTIFKTIDKFKEMGAIIEECNIPIIDYAIPAYYICACAEASSNLSRYDGIRYGYRSDKDKNLLDMYYNSRCEGFGIEVKRRIMLGSFVLSSGYYDAYYKKALKTRNLIKKSFDDLFDKYDIILTPTTPTTAFSLGKNLSDPLKMYLSDIYTVSVNLAGIPAVSIPCGFDKNNMPIGMQLIGNAFSENKLVKLAYAFQSKTNYHIQKTQFCKEV